VAIRQLLEAVAILMLHTVVDIRIAIVLGALLAIQAV